MSVRRGEPHTRPSRAGHSLTEGDLLIGADCRTAVGTLVERTTRYVMLLHLPDGRSASGVERAMRQAINTLPEQLRRSITWDQGREMAYHSTSTATMTPLFWGSADTGASGLGL